MNIVTGEPPKISSFKNDVTLVVIDGEGFVDVI